MRQVNSLLTAWMKRENGGGFTCFRFPDSDWVINLLDHEGKLVATGRGPAPDEAAQNCRHDCERNGIEL